MLQQFITDKELGLEDICNFRITEIFCADDDGKNHPRYALLRVEFTITERGPIINTVVTLTGTPEGYWHGDQPHLCDIEQDDVAEFDLEKQLKIFSNKSSVELSVAHLAIKQFFEEQNANSEVYANRKYFSPDQHVMYCDEYA